MPTIYVGAGLLALYFIYQIFKDDDDDDHIIVEPDPLPNNGSGIPAGWTPTNAVARIKSAFDWTWHEGGTDEPAIYSALADKTKDQLVAIYNDFNRQHATKSKPNLFKWFEDEMSGEDLMRAMDYFNGTGLRGLPTWQFNFKNCYRNKPPMRTAVG